MAQTLTIIGPGPVGPQTLNQASRRWEVMPNTTINAGTGSYGISIVVNSVATQTGGSIQINTANATGLLVQNDGTTATMNADTVITVAAATGGQSDWSGVRAINRGNATLNGVKVDVSSVGTNASFTANALFANGAGTLITATDSTLITHGAYGFGVNANSGTVNLAGGGNTITTSGNYGRGIYATAGTSAPTTGGTVTAKQLTIATTGNNAIGAYALTRGSIDLGTDTAISTTGVNSYGIEASGVTATVSMGANGQIETAGNAAWGAASVAGGKITFAGSPISVKTSGQQSGAIGAYALFATGADSSIDASAAQPNITTSGTNARGAFADTGGKITLGGGTTISTTGAGADGIAAIAATSSGSAATVIVGAGTSITTQGASAFGARALTGGVIDMTAGNTILATSGTGAYGMFSSTGSSGANSLIQAKDVTVTTANSNSDGARADTGSKIEIRGTSSISTTRSLSHGIIALTSATVNVLDSLSITTAGDQSSGAVVDGEDTTLNFQGTNDIVTTGEDASAIVVRNEAQLAFDNASNVLPSLTVQGSGSALLRAQNPRSTLDIGPGVTVQNGGDYPGVYGALSRTGSTINFAQGSSLQLSSANSPALATVSGGNIVLDAATVQSSGSGTSCGLLAAIDVPPSASNTLTMTNGATLTSTQAPALCASNAALEVSADESQISGDSLILAVANSKINLAASNNSTLEGDAVASSSIVDIDLDTASQWTGAATNVHDVIVGATTLWTMTGNSTAAKVNNDGEIVFTAPTADPTQLANYKTLTADDYVGSSGTFRLNTLLGADSSPSDRLVINGGTATGTTTLDITNTVGAGALTTGDGILVVQATNGATTAADAFTLAGGSVRAGNYIYRLYRGGANGQGENWYLRSFDIMSSVAPIPALSPLTLLLLTGALGLAGLAVARRQRG